MDAQLDNFLPNLIYVEEPNENLVCCICHSPFLEPTSSPCGHTFCRGCIEQALAVKSWCPIDRSDLTTDTLRPAVQIITNLVNELKVHCPFRLLGCKETFQRQNLQHHLENDCNFVPVPCQHDECREKILKKDLEKHKLDCKYRIVQCQTCGKSFQNEAFNRHQDACPEEEMRCEFCGKNFKRSDLSKHTSMCPEKHVNCDYAKYGCIWQGLLRNYDEHLKQCSYYAIGGYIRYQESRYTSLELENQRLREELEIIQYEVASTREEMEMSKVDQSYNVPETFNEQYPPLSHPSFYQIESYIQQLEEQIIPTQDHILMDNEKIRDELGTLSGSLASLELKQNYSFMTESLKTKEEIQSLRSMYQSLARQLQFLLAEKSNRIANPRTGFSTRTRPNPGSSASNGEGHSRAFKDMAEKTKL